MRESMIKCTRPYLPNRELLEAACEAAALSSTDDIKFVRWGAQACSLRVNVEHFFVYYNDTIILCKDESTVCLNADGWLSRGYWEGRQKRGCKQGHSRSPVTLRYMQRALKESGTKVGMFTAGRVLMVHQRGSGCMYEDNMVIHFANCECMTLSQEERDTGVTPVVFRRWRKDGDLIALFLNRPENIHNASVVSSYMHHGQHSNAHYTSVMAQTVDAFKFPWKTAPFYLEDIKELVARENDVQLLYKELTERGYNLQPVKRDTPTFEAIRLREIECMQGASK